MRILICPDKFAGTLTAAQAADAIAAGWAQASPNDQLELCPLADGGPGFLDILATALGATPVPVLTCDPLGRPVPGSVLVHHGVAYLESAQACGLHLLTPAQRDPRTTTSYGLGLLLAAAVESGAGEVVIGLGGSATNDAGAGMLAALGAAPLDAAGYALPYGGAALLGCTGLSGVPRLRGVRLRAACDVDNPLTGPDGATAVFGPQKGARPQDVPVLEAALARFAAVLVESLPAASPDLAARPGGGAAGGLGAALLACGARIVSGIGLVRDLVGLDAAVRRCDLVLTGEGRFDGPSLHGKVVGAVAAVAREHGRGCLVLAGQVAVDPAQAAAAGVTGYHAVADNSGGLAAALADPAGGLRHLAAAVARGARGSAPG